MGMLYCFKNAIDVRVTWAPYEYILRLNLFNNMKASEKKTPPDKLHCRFERKLVSV